MSYRFGLPPFQTERMLSGFSPSISFLKLPAIHSVYACMGAVECDVQRYTVCVHACMMQLRVMFTDPGSCFSTHLCPCGWTAVWWTLQCSIAK